MQISDLSTLSRLQPLVQAVLAPAQALPTSENQSDLPATSPLDRVSARLHLTSTEDSQEQALDLSRLNPEQLLESLRRAEHNLDSAQAFVSEVADLLGELRQEYGIAGDVQLALTLETPIGSFRLDPAELDPERLLAAFSLARAQLSAETLQQNYQALAELAEDVLNEGAQISPATRMSPLLSSETEGPETPVSPDLTVLSAEAEALVARADELQASLTLAPTPNSPDVLELFHAFAEIFQRLEQDLNQLYAHVQERHDFDQHSSEDFSQQWQDTLNYTRDKLNRLRSENREDFQEGLQNLMQYLVLKTVILTRLSQESGSPDAGWIEAVSRELSGWSRRQV
jgi:hypothetical protein